MRAVKLCVNPLALILGMACAAFGFSYALATTDAAAARAAKIASRTVGSNLRISNPFLLPGQDSQFPGGGDVSSDPDGFDLGDACFGSQIVRHISALGGVTPYRFTSSTVGSNGSGLALDLSGRVTGAVPAGGPSPVKFTALLTDAAGGTRSGIFRVGSQACAPGEFRFAIDRLPAAQVGQDYITRIEALNGDATTIFSVSGTITLNGNTQSSLEFLGLTLFKDGTLAGRPLASGTLNFTARAMKGAAAALNRAGTATDQNFTINIAAEDIIQSVLAVSNANLGGRVGSTIGSRLTLSAFFNSDGKRSTDFIGARFVLRFAGATFSGTFDSRAQIRTTDLSVNLIAPDGLLRIQLRNQDFATLLGSNNLLFGQVTAIIEIEIGDSYLGAEAVQFDAKSRNGKFVAHYRLGKERQLGGLFQVLALKALDVGNSVAFKTNFLVSHVKGRSDIEFGVARDVAVHIGPGFHQAVTLIKGRGVFPPGGVRTLKIDGRRKLGQLTTYALPAVQTGIVPSSQANGQAQTFQMQMDISTTTTLLSGAASRRIFPAIFFP